MPRREECPQVYEVAQEFRARCLDSDGSLLWNRPDVWTVDNLRLLQARLLTEPATSVPDFWVKLREQLAGVPAECYMILSDALVVYSLPSLSMSKDTKMSFLRRAREIGGTELPALDTRISQAFVRQLRRAKTFTHTREE